MKKMLKRADGSYSQRGLWDNIRANKGSGKEPTKEMLKQEKKIKASSKKTGGKSMSSFLEESKELMFGGPSKKYLDGGPGTTPTMTPQQALKEMAAGRMTGAQANAASGYGNKQKKYTDAENIDNLKKVFVGSHTVDAQGNIAPKPAAPKKPMVDISTAGLRPTAPAESTNAYTRRLKSGGKKKMGGKNC
jgi:hypothetical protein